MTTASDEIRARIAANPVWYHTIDIAPGITTPGWFDLRSVIDRIPWPDVKGKRCLDVGTYDGFLAFELERRGASEVVAADVAHHEDWDWAPRHRALGPQHLAAVAGEKGKGFEIARDALGSKVQREWCSVYDLDPARLGTFDVVTCGSLLLHLRDPFRALEAIRGVCGAEFLSIEQIDFRLSAMSPRWPALRLSGEDGQWTIPNVAAHLRMLHIAGFDLIRKTKPFSEPFGPGHPAHGRPARKRLKSVIEQAYLGGPGVGVSAALTRVAI